MKNRLKSVFAAPLAASFLLLSVTHGASDSQVLLRCNAPGAFVAWQGRQVVVSESNRFYACDALTGQTTLSDYRAPKQLNEAEKLAVEQSVKETFPDSVAQKDPVTGTDIAWKNFAVVKVAGAGALPADAGLAVYLAQGRTSSGKPSGPATSLSGLSALLYRHSGQFRLLRLELSGQDPKEWPGWGYPWDSLSGRFDPQTGRIFLFFARLKLGSDQYSPRGWAPFHAWWFDPQSASVMHVVLPNGRWFSDVAADPILRPLGCFSCGCDCYRNYDMKVRGGSVFIQITAESGALRDATTGTYVLRPTSSKWQKVPGTDSTTTLDQLADDGCKIALNRSGGVDVLSLCELTRRDP